MNCQQNDSGLAPDGSGYLPAGGAACDPAGGPDFTWESWHGADGSVAVGPVKPVRPDDPRPDHVVG